MVLGRWYGRRLYEKTKRIPMEKLIEMVCDDVLYSFDVSHDRDQPA
jgi:hypothetical protein